MFALSSFFSEFSDVTKKRDAVNIQANKSIANSFLTPPPTFPLTLNTTFQFTQ